MTSLRRLAAIVLAAGSGSRSGGAVPKQYRRLGARSVLGHSVAAFLAHPAVDDVVVVVTPGDEERAKAVRTVGDIYDLVENMVARGRLS